MYVQIVVVVVVPHCSMIIYSLSGREVPVVVLIVLLLDNITTNSIMFITMPLAEAHYILY